MPFWIWGSISADDHVKAMNSPILRENPPVFMSMFSHQLWHRRTVFCNNSKLFRSGWRWYFHIFIYFHIFSYIFIYFPIFSYIFLYFHIFSYIFIHQPSLKPGFSRMWQCQAQLQDNLESTKSTKTADERGTLVELVTWWSSWYAEVARQLYGCRRLAAWILNLART